MEAISSASARVNAAGGGTELSPVKAQLQMSLLKKSLEVQKEQTAELMNMLQGKGTIIDIRV